MKYIEMVEFLVSGTSRTELYRREGVSTDSEALLIYLKEELAINSEVVIFELEETDDLLNYDKDGVPYVQLFPMDYALELIENDFRGCSAIETAERLLQHRITDA